MGQQQLLLIILGVIIVGVAIAVGISQFGTNAAISAKDAIIGDLANLAANAFQYKIKPTNLGGGNGTYTAYTIPKGFDDNANAAYSAVLMNDGAGKDTAIIFTGTSKAYTGNAISDTVFFNGSQSSPDFSSWNPQ